MNEIRVLIAEDHKAVLTGLKMIIDSETDMKVIDEAKDGQKALKLAQELKPDVLIMDVSMPEMSGLTAAKKLKRIVPEIKILTLTRHTDKACLQELLQVGVSGYVLKQSESEEMLRAIRVVFTGGNYLDPAITSNIFNIVTGKQNKMRGEISGKQLSERETEVLRLIARGYSNKKISNQLVTSVKTIETQKASALRKLNISGRNEIVNYAILQGWLQEN